MMQKIDHIKKPDDLRQPGIEMTDELKHIQVPGEQSCRTLPKVRCPVKGTKYCVFSITRVTPVETDYACPACGVVIKKDVFTTAGWKTLVLDKKHRP